MRLSAKVLFVMAFVIIVTAQAKAEDILYFVDHNNGTDQMAAALGTLSGATITVATSPTDFATKIATGTYNLGIFSAQLNYDPSYSTALAALATFVAGGGNAIVNSWFTPAGTDVRPFGADYTGDTNGTHVNMTGFNAGVTNPVGIVNTVPPYATFSTGMTLDAVTGTSIAGTFFTIGGSSPTDGEAAVIVGNGGHSIVNGFLNDTAGAQGEQIYINEINSFSGPNNPTPEPSSLLLFGTGLSALAGFALRRKQQIA